MMLHVADAAQSLNQVLDHAMHGKRRARLHSVENDHLSLTVHCGTEDIAAVSPRLTPSARWHLHALISVLIVSKLLEASPLARRSRCGPPCKPPSRRHTLSTLHHTEAECRQGQHHGSPLDGKQPGQAAFSTRRRAHYRKRRRWRERGCRRRQRCWHMRWHRKVPWRPSWPCWRRGSHPML